jgi:DnaK suppressor protein
MDNDRARQLLAAERERLERLLSGLGPVVDGDLSDQSDPADKGTDLYQDEYDAGLAEDLREQLAAVERAEQRLSAGTYGLSVKSGKPIPDERLEAFPAAELTTDEQREN